MLNEIKQKFHLFDVSEYEIDEIIDFLIYQKKIFLSTKLKKRMSKYIEGKNFPENKKNELIRITEKIKFIKFENNTALGYMSDEINIFRIVIDDNIIEISFTATGEFGDKESNMYIDKIKINSSDDKIIKNLRKKLKFKYITCEEFTEFLINLDDRNFVVDELYKNIIIQ